MRVKWKEGRVKGSFNEGKLVHSVKRGTIIFERNGHCLVLPDQSNKLLPIAREHLTELKKKSSCND